MPGLFVLHRAWIRIIGIILVIAAGLPVGREGPMVCIGGSCGLIILTKVGFLFFCSLDVCTVSFI